MTVLQQQIFTLHRYLSKKKKKSEIIATQIGTSTENSEDFTNK